MLREPRPGFGGPIWNLIYPRIYHRAVLAPNIISCVRDDDDDRWGTPFPAATVGVAETGFRFNLIVDLLQTLSPWHAILDTGGRTSQCALIRFDVLSDVSSRSPTKIESAAGSPGHGGAPSILRLVLSSHRA